jgi:hypothetical protein
MPTWHITEPRYGSPARPLISEEKRPTAETVRLWYILFICYQQYDLTGEANASLWPRKGMNSNGYPVR